ncbi:homocysteine S-methyltransferase family protein [Aestuariispira insulae]|uniref:Homocysteine S-methyltransferase n=1 Tax=Aestuariispira insulae TaxID=1461337 RepID=A0A3D9HS34_9PROT|nr:homocysteine S-methyltransferase family protein [Aestuariispira insulae]RED52269.1 homocysteine S-methyltransferase [Aestuariispira insulae]
MRTVKEALNQRVLLADGSVSRLLDNADTDMKRDFYGMDKVLSVLNVTRPDLVREAHLAYLLAGADVVRTNSLTASPLTLKQYGLQDEAFVLNHLAAENAAKAVDSVPGEGRRRFVLGVIRDDGWNATPAEIEAAVDVQVQGLLSGGADAIVLDCLAGIGRIQPVLTAARRARASVNSEAPIYLQEGREVTDFSRHVQEQADGIIRYRPGDPAKGKQLAEWIREEACNLIGGGDLPGKTQQLDSVLRDLAEDGLRPVQSWVREEGPVDRFEPASSWSHFPDGHEAEREIKAAKALEKAV